MSEIRKPTIMDKITPLQAQAWGMENQAFDAPIPSAYRVVAEQIRTQDVHEKIQELFNRSDEQNKIIAIGLALKQPVPIFESVR